jgi:CubicO group peptidase (beta-lactamase class C family)
MTIDIRFNQTRYSFLLLILVLAVLTTVTASLPLVALAESSAAGGPESFNHFQRVARALSEPTPRTTVLDSAGLDSVVSEIREQYYIPGLAACIVKDGRVAWKMNDGYANVGEEIEVADETIFMLASISKTFVGIAVMQLWEQGLLGLEDDVNDYLPFTVTNPYFTAIPITPRMLLAHTSSIAYNASAWLPLITWGGDPTIPLGQYLQSYLEPGGLRYQNSNYNIHVPGNGAQYSNVGYALAGYLVEVISGQLFEDYCQEAIFGPLGMNETSWFLAGLDPDQVAMPTQYSGGAFIPYGQFGFPVYPAGQLRTSSLQLARHLIAFMQLGQIDDTRILQSSSVQLMTTIQYPDVPPVFPGYDWGLGWFRIPYGSEWLWGHTGGIFGVSTFMFYNPDGNYGVIELTNADGNDGHSFILSELLDYASQLADETATYLSTFTAVRNGQTARLVWEVLDPTSPHGFHVWRQEAQQPATRLTAHPVTTPAADHAQRYEFLDSAAPPEATEYRLQEIGADGLLTWLGSVRLEPSGAMVPEFNLAQNHPNPFNPETTIAFRLDSPSRTRLAVFDMSGRHVMTLLDEPRPTGLHNIVWDGRDEHGMHVATGIYFYRLQTDHQVQTRKMILAK